MRSLLLKYILILTLKQNSQSNRKLSMRINHKHFVYIISLPELAWKNKQACDSSLLMIFGPAEGSLNLSFHFVSKGHILIAASIYLNFRSTGRCFRQIEINFGQIMQIIVKLKSRERVEYFQIYLALPRF